MTSFVCYLNRGCFLLRGGFPSRGPEVGGSNPAPATKTKTRGASTLPFNFQDNNLEVIYRAIGALAWHESQIAGIRLVHRLPVFYRLCNVACP